MQSIEAHYADDIVQRVRDLDSEQRTLSQKLVFVLLSGVLAKYSSEEQESGLGERLLVGYPVNLVVGVVMGWLAVAGSYYLTHWLIGDWSDQVIYVVAALGLICVFMFKRDSSTGAVEFEVDENDESQVTGLWLGRMHEALNAQAAMSVAALGLIFGAQAGMMMYVSNHLGAGEVVGHAESFLLALDNFCRGVFLDIFDVFQIHLGHPLEHTVWTSTVTFLLRTAMNVLVVLSVYYTWSHLRLRHMLADLPKEPLDYPSMIEWLRTIRGSRWCRSFYDEYIFLMATELYLDGRFEEFKEQTGRYPRLQIQNDIQRLFTDADGDPLWHGYWDHWSHHGE